MTQRVLLESALVLHHRPYRNSSLIVELFSQQYGRVTAVARSARGYKSRYQGHLQIFTPLRISWSGRRELMNVNQVELDGLPYQLSGQALLCAFYLNELLLRLLPKDDPYPAVFVNYQNTLRDLEQGLDLAIVLRRFEKRLLEHLGYGLSFNVDIDGYYQWLPDHGFLRCDHLNLGQDRIFLGRSLLALQAETWDNSEDLAAAKRLMRLVLQQHLGDKPIKSRELLQ